MAAEERHLAAASTPEPNLEPCDDCSKPRPLSTFGRIRVSPKSDRLRDRRICVDCRLLRRRAAGILDGTIVRRPPPDVRDHSDRKLVQRWHHYPDFVPLTARELNRLRGRPHRTSADGNWRELLDDDGQTIATLVRIAVAPRAKAPEPGAVP
jgi:hypothetical protein